MRKPIIEIVTHSGAFHADDVLAGAVLRGVFKDATVTRSRSPEKISPAPGRVVFDVGGIHDPERMMFDHHQKGAPRREDGTTYSSFGMIWKEFGKEWLRIRGFKADIVDDVAQRMDDQVVRIIDSFDNGEMSPSDLGKAFDISLISLVGDMRPGFDETDEAAMNIAYDDAVTLASTVLIARARSISHDLRARKIVEEAVEKAAGDSVIHLPFAMNYDDIIHDLGADHVEFVIYPRPGGSNSPGDWAICTVKREGGDFVNRRDLPEEWGGLSGQELADASGVDDAVFCHAKLFIACAKSFEGIMEMAEIATGPRQTTYPSM